MRTHTQRILPLIAVVAAAAILTLMLSYGVNAHTTFQSSPVGPTPVTPAPGPTSAPPTLPAPTPFIPPTSVQPVPVPSLEPPTVVPLPAEVLPTPTISGFLPAPTIVNPDDLGPLPLAQPAITNPGSAPEPTPTVTPTDNSGLRTGLVLLNLIWMLCGGILLIGGAVTIILLLRRSGQL